MATIPPHGCQRNRAEPIPARTRRTRRMRPERARARTFGPAASQSPPGRRATAVAAESIGQAPPSLLVARPWSTAPRGAAGRCAPRADARLALARRRRWAAAARITPLSITVRAAARLPLSYRCTWRRPAAPAPPFYRLPPPLIPPTSASPLPACLAVSPCTTPLARIPRPLHPQEQPHSHPNAASLCPTWQACCLALLVEEGTRVSAASVAVRHSAAGLSWAGAGQVQARAGSRLWCTYVSAACGAVWCTYGPTRER